MGADGEHDLRLADAAREFRFLICATLRKRRHIAECAELTLRRRAGEHGRKVVGNDDLHVCRSVSYVWA
jgi:hypothetical protein